MSGKFALFTLIMSCMAVKESLAAAVACSPAVACDMYCPYGNVLDANGCPKCECIPDPCISTTCLAGTVCQTEPCDVFPCDPQPECIKVCPMCDIECPFGMPEGADGCPECKCNPDRCLGVQCDSGSHCEPVQVECFTTPCYPVAECVPNPTCPPVCKMYCQYGNVVDENGCALCECNENPCSVVKCRSGYHCEVIQPQCFTTPCPPHAECIQDKKRGPKFCIRSHFKAVAK